MNLMGAWAFASTADCGMECCKPGAWEGTTSFEAPSCCQMDDLTCGFEAGKYEELFDEALCCFHKVAGSQLTEGALVAAAVDGAPVYPRTHFPALPSTGPPGEIPLYLSNATFLC